MVWKAPHLLISPGDIDQYVILTGDPSRVAWMASHLKDSYKVSSNREYVIYRGYYKDLGVTIASTGIGAPSTAIAMEELIKCGANVFVRIGTCGAFVKGVKPGDIVLPYGSLRLDGVTSRLVPPGYPAVASPRLYHYLEKYLKESNLNYVTGIIASDDLFYGDIDFYKKLRDLGIVAIEMETSTIMVLASLHGKESASILVVDGNILEGTGKGETGGTEEGETPRIVRENMEKLLDIVLTALYHHNKEK